jgi:hypothetical protein
MKPHCFPFHRARLSGDQRRRRGCLWSSLNKAAPHRLADRSILSHIDGMDLFSCPDCKAKHAIIRRQAPPDEPPVCEVCDGPFQPTDGGDWLTYQRADPIVLTEGDFNP